MSRYKLEVWTKKPVDVEAIQFWGWTEALTLLDTGAPVFYVPEGAEHRMRRENEHDRGNHHILDEATAFLIVMTPDGQERADPGNYIVRDAEGCYSVYLSGPFLDAFDKKPVVEREFPIGA